MSVWILLVSFILVTSSTMALFWWIGITPNSLTFSKADAVAFRNTRSPVFAFFMVTATIFATLTSLATVYVFFLGSSKLFGLFIVAAPISIALSSFVTVELTRRVLASRPDFQKLLTEADRTSGVVARIVWTDDTKGHSVARIVKWISLVNIASVLWLEFSVFGDLAASMLGSAIAVGTSHIAIATLIVALSVFCVFFLLLRYGLRGFVVSDVLHSPFVILSVIAALTGVYIAYEPQIPHSNVFQPVIPALDVTLFVLHVFALNLVFVLLTEGHWFRLWLFDSRENDSQWKGTLFTAITWAVLGLAGCLAAVITPEAGTPGFLPVAQAIQTANPALAMVFWIGVCAAIFSVADAQIYNFMIVKSFDPDRGEVDKSINRPSRPLTSSVMAAILFSLVYAATRYLDIPFEKLVFILFPFCLNILPGFLPVAFGKKPDIHWIFLSLTGYVGFSAYGLFRPDHSLAANLAAALVPVAFSLPALLFAKPLPKAVSAPEARNGP